MNVLARDLMPSHPLSSALVSFVYVSYCVPPLYIIANLPGMVQASKLMTVEIASIPEL